MVVPIVGVRIGSFRRILALFLLSTIVTRGALSFVTSHRSVSSFWNPTRQSSSSCLAAPKKKHPLERQWDDRSSQIYHDNVRLTYSFNFRRHLVWKKTRSVANDTFKFTIVKSFEWLDQALFKYPKAILQPLDMSCRDDWGLSINKHDDSKVSDAPNVGDLFVAGGSPGNFPGDGTEEELNPHYPLRKGPMSIQEMNDNWHEIKDFLQSELKWLPQQVDRLLQQPWTMSMFRKDLDASEDRVALEQSHPLKYYPVDLLKERIRFLLAPLPGPDIVSLYNQTDVAGKTTTAPTDAVNFLEDAQMVDWPIQFYRHGCGAGMSAAQVSHAIQTMPYELLFLPPFMTAPTEASSINVKNMLDVLPNPSLVARFYDETPSVVMTMARKQLDPLLLGCTNMNNAAIAYLHWKGWEWTQCRIAMHALHCFTTATTDPVIGGTRGRMPPQLDGVAMYFLQLRLQIKPWQLEAMYRTHPQLAGYSLVVLKRHLDSLQTQLGITSLEVQQLVLQMPSLLGTSVDSLSLRVAFWKETIGLAADQLRQAALRHPSILQYNVTGNLQNKFHFFHNNLKMDSRELVKMSVSYPDVWGRSLENHYLPLCDAFCRKCNVTLEEYGRILVKAPLLMRCSWEGNLRVKLEYLQSRLCLEDNELKTIVETSPMVLMQSIRSSLEPKITFLEDAGDKQQGKRVVKNNPSLLLNSKKTLETRVSKALAASNSSSPVSLVDALGPPQLPSFLSGSMQTGRSSRRQRPVLLLALADGDEESDSGSFRIERAFANVDQAAAHAGWSRSNMYRVLREGGRSLENGRRYQYADSASARFDISELSTGSDATSEQAQGVAPSAKSAAEETRCLVVYTTGRAFPPERKIRGRRRAGGMALGVVGWTAEDWRNVASQIWKGLEGRIRLGRGGSWLLMGYPYTRPSRPRCSLYVCREALRVATAWVENENRNATRDASSRSTINEIMIVSDCNYVVDTLQNTTRILEWASQFSTAKEMMESSRSSTRGVTNIDILYPLAKTYEQLVCAIDSGIKATKREGKSATEVVKFRRAIEFQPDVDVTRLADGARQAAQRMYDQVR